MADQLTSAPASPVQPGTSGVAPQQPPVAPPTQNVSPVSPSDKQAQPPQINLHELPQFRQVQATYERQLAEERKKRQEAEMRGLDDFEKVQYEAQQLREQVAQYESQMREAQLQAEKFQTISTIAATTGVPIDALMNAGSEGEAWMLAWQARSAQFMPQPQTASPQPVQQPVQSPASWPPVNAQPQYAPPPVWTPDVGGAAAVNASDRFSQEIAEAQKRGDPAAYVRALRQQQGFA